MLRINKFYNLINFFFLLVKNCCTKTIVNLLLLFLFSNQAFALKPHIATYSLLMAGFEIAIENRELSLNNGIYRYVENANTIGFAKLVKDYEIKASSVFTIDDLGLHPSNYQLFEKEGDKIKKNINITPKYNEIDPFTLVLSLSYALKNNPKQSDFYFLVNDGEDIEKHHYQQVTNEDTNLIKIINKDKQIEAFFAKDKDYLPVLIKKKHFSYQLLTLK